MMQFCGFTYTFTHAFKRNLVICTYSSWFLCIHICAFLMLLLLLLESFRVKNLNLDFFFRFQSEKQLLSTRSLNLFSKYSQIKNTYSQKVGFIEGTRTYITATGLILTAWSIKEHYIILFVQLQSKSALKKIEQSRKWEKGRTKRKKKDEATNM